MITSLLAIAVVTNGPLLLVGKPGLSLEGTARVTVKFGRLTGKADNLYRLRLHSSVTEADAAKQLTDRGFVVVVGEPAVPIHHSYQSAAKFAALRHAQEKMAASEKEEEPDSFYEALEEYLRIRTDANGNFDSARYERAIAHREQMPVATLQGSGAHSPNGIFTFVGPTNLPVPYQQYFGINPLSGRKNGVAVAPNGTIFAASAGGGVWRSTNGGVNFTNVSNNWVSQDTGCVAVQPTNSNVVVVGTGDKNGFPGYANGIMRSIDGGNTWVKASGAIISSSEAVTKILFDPLNASLVIACTRDVGGSNGAVYRSINGGEVWNRIASLPFGQWRDVDVSPVFGGVRTWWAAADGPAGPQLFWSQNGGSNWTQTAPPYTSMEARVEIAVSKVTANKVYFVSASNQQVWAGFTTGGWSRIDLGIPTGTTASPNWSQSGYDNHITCTPNGSFDRIWLGLISLAVSNNSGASWGDLGRTYFLDARTHNDQHDIIPDPNVANRYWVCNDGGLYRLTYDGANFILFEPFPNATIGDLQPRRMVVHRSNPNYMVLGTQDNASPSSRGSFGTWFNLQGGDGGWGGYDWTTTGRHISGAQGGLFYQYNDYTTLNVANFFPAVPSGTFLTPMVYAGSTPAPYAASNQLYRYNGSNWVAVVALPGIGQCLERGVNSNKLWIGTQNGFVVRASLPSSTFTLGSIPGSVNDIKESPQTPETILCAASGGGLWKCVNANGGSRVWTNVSGSGATALPSVPINCIELDHDEENTYYAGTDVGLFMTTDGGQNWANVNPLGLPNVTVTELHIDFATKVLYVSTFGRGVWRVPLQMLRLDSLAFDRIAVYGGTIVNLTARLNLAAPPSGVNVTMQNVSPWLTVPSPIRINPGQTSRTIPVQTIVVTTTRVVTCQGLFNFGTRTASITLHPRVRIAGFNWQQTAVYSGETAYGDITTEAPAPLDVSVYCATVNNLINHPKYNRVAAGTSIAFCDGEAAVVASPTVATTTVSLWGTSATDSTTIIPPPQFRDLIISPGAVYAGDPATGTLRLNTRSAHSFVYVLGSSSSYVSTPPGATMGSNALSGTFPIQTTVSLISRTATITASWNGQTATRNLSIYATLVLDQFFFDQSLIGPGDPSNLFVSVTQIVKYPGTNLRLSVDKQGLIIPTTFPMAIGEDSVSVPVTGGQVSQNTLVTVTGTFGDKVKTATITVTP